MVTWEPNDPLSSSVTPKYVIVLMGLNDEVDFDESEEDVVPLSFSFHNRASVVFGAISSMLAHPYYYYVKKLYLE